ncbi:hypothetical protein, partial [Escherichia coli]
QSHRALSEHKTLSISWSHYQRRNIAPKLRALIDHVKEWRQQLA